MSATAPQLDFARNMLRLAIRELWRRPLRNGLAIAGLGAAVAVLCSLSSLGSGYRRALTSELGRMGTQLMLVPIGCPYDAAARVLKGRTLDNSLPESALEMVRSDPAVDLAAPLLIAALPQPDKGRADVWVGLEDTPRLLMLKPWWRVKQGSDRFPDPESVILGCEAAEAEMRAVGDKLFSPETGKSFRVTGVLERSGTSDDSLFFIPLRTAQAMFQQPGRLTAIAIRLRDPALLPEATERLQRVPGAQVVTLTEMRGVFLNLVGSVRTLSDAVAMIAIAISLLSVLNTLLAAVVERTSELSIMRALGASRRQVFGLLTAESLLLASSGTMGGLLLAIGIGPVLDQLARRWVPLAPSGPMFLLDGGTILECFVVGLAVGLASSLYPAWQASRVQPARVLGEQ